MTLGDGSDTVGSEPEGALERKPTVTHKLEVMRVCGRIVVVGKKHRVVEDRGFEALMERRGEFTRLAGWSWEC